MTEEEKEHFKEAKRDYQHGRGSPFERAKIGHLLSIIDSLEARNKELESEKTFYQPSPSTSPSLTTWCEATERDDYFRIIEERGKQITDLCDRVSGLEARNRKLKKDNKIYEEREEERRTLLGEKINLSNKITSLKTDLSALLEAAEPVLPFILSEIERYKYVRGDKDVNNHLGDLRRLQEAVEKGRGK